MHRLVEAMRRAVIKRRCVMNADVSTLGSAEQQVLHVRLAAPQDGSGFTEREMLALEKAAPAFAAHLQEMGVELIGLSADGRIYVLLLPRGTVCAEDVVVAVAQWFDATMKDWRCDLEVVDGPTQVIKPWTGDGA